MKFEKGRWRGETERTERMGRLEGGGKGKRRKDRGVREEGRVGQRRGEKNKTEEHGGKDSLDEVMKRKKEEWEEKDRR